MRKIQQFSSQPRFSRINQTVSALDFRDLKFRGFHKFKKIPFDFEEPHLLIPEKLNFSGDILPDFEKIRCTAFCGTTSPTEGAAMLAELLSQWVIDFPCGKRNAVISGGVHGVDTAAHLGAIDVDGLTYAVIANNIENGLHPYVPSRTHLQEQILRHGGIISEYSDFVDDRKERLLERDRIISGLSETLIVIQATFDSASVDTAKRAFLQGVDVIVIDWSKLVPGLMPEVNIPGNIQLLDLGIGRPFPTTSILTFESSDFQQKFYEAMADGRK